MPSTLGMTGFNTLRRRASAALEFGQGWAVDAGPSESAVLLQSVPRHRAAESVFVEAVAGVTVVLEAGGMIDHRVYTELTDAVAS